MGALPDPKRLGATGTDRAAGENLRVLVAEDNEIGLELTCMMAKRLGMDADGAHDGHHALQMVRQAAAEGRPYSLVLMDFMMPVVDGIEATRRLRRAGFAAETLPVIALTAVAEPRELGRFTEAGGQAYLSKPLDMDQLSATLEAWLPGESLEQGLVLARQGGSLLGRYIERKNATLAQIDAVLQGRSASSRALDEIRDSLHKLAGTAGLFGDDALSIAAARCEQDLIEAEADEALGVLRRHRARLGAAA